MDEKVEEDSDMLDRRGKHIPQIKGILANKWTW